MSEAINDGFSNRETWYVNDMLGEYGHVMAERGDTFPDEDALADYLRTTAREAATPNVLEDEPVAILIDAVLAHVEWTELAARYVELYPELIEDGTEDEA